MASSSNGNPYCQFLGLPETIIQPDHYQLLGLERFTSDAKRIQDAAIAQNKKLASWQNNDQLYAQVRRLQLEVANAQIVLTDPTKKQAYDQTLAPTRLESETVEETFQQETQEFPLRPSPSPKRARPSSASPSHDPPFEEEAAEHNFGIHWAVWGAAGLAVLILIGLIVMGPGESPTDDSRAAATDSSRDEKADETRTDDSRVANTDSSLGEEAGETRTDNGLEMTLVWCPPGDFPMGEDRSKVDVTLSNGFWLGQTEVTQGQWEAVMGSTPWEGQPFVKEGSNYPAAYVSWEDAVAFCEKLTEQERKAGRLPDDWEYTLPTEAQWEYACRAGTTTVYSFGDDDSQLGDYAWYGAFSKGGNAKEEKYAHAVGTKKPNPWGLSDMHGNVWEWYRDSYAENLPGGRDPEVTVNGSRRVFRGGGWSHGPESSRSARRSKTRPDARVNYLGFRVARLLSE